MKTYYLYYLIDPNTNEVRYVGITYRPEKRLNEHVRLAIKQQKTHKDCWILKLLNNNQKPIFKIVFESTNKNEIIDFEINHISKYNNLTNSTTGGEYFNFTNDVIKKLKTINKGNNNPNYGKTWTAEQKKRQSLKYKNRKLNDNWKRNIGLSAKHRKEVIINGIKYTSIKEAKRILHIGFKKAKSFVKDNTL